MLIKGLTLSTQYEPFDMTWRLVLHYSIDDNPKTGIGVTLAEEFLEGAPKSHVCNLILELFLKELVKNGVEGEAITFILEWTKTKLNHIYADQHNWITTMGVHNSAFAKGGPVFSPTASVAASATINDTPVSSLARSLPGANEVVEYPCDCEPHAHAVNNRQTLYYLIIHLNDEAGWSREAIADWIDKLHDSGTINAEFQSWDEKVS